MKHFHQFVKEMRTRKDLTLREFCKLTSLDPSNWSKIERGLEKPLKSPEMIKRISDVLGLNPDEEATLRELAIIDSIPVQLISEKKVLESLPIFFRTVRGEKPNEEELKILIEKIKNA